MDKKKRPGRPRGEGPTRKNVSFRMIDEIYDECQEIAKYRERSTLTTVIENLLEGWREEMRKKHNKGKPIEVPKREADE